MNGAIIQGASLCLRCMPEVEGRGQGTGAVVWIRDSSEAFGVNLKRWTARLGVGIFVYLFFIRSSELMAGLWVSFNGKELEMNIVGSLPPTEVMFYRISQIFASPSIIHRRLSCVDPTFIVIDFKHFFFFSSYDVNEQKIDSKIKELSLSTCCRSNFRSHRGSTTFPRGSLGH